VAPVTFFRNGKSSLATSFVFYRLQKPSIAAIGFLPDRKIVLATPAGFFRSGKSSLATPSAFSEAAKTFHRRY